MFKSLLIIMYNTFTIPIEILIRGSSNDYKYMKSFDSLYIDSVN